MKFENLTPEEMEKAKACKTPDEIFALAQEEGFELSDEQLEAVSGGDWDCWSICSKYVKQECDNVGYGPGPW